MHPEVALLNDKPYMHPAILTEMQGREIQNVYNQPSRLISVFFAGLREGPQGSQVKFD